MTENEGAASSSQGLGVMEGKGFYNRHSRPQHSAVAFGLPLLEQAVEAVPLPGPGEVFRVADYGVAGGHNSMQPVQTIIEGIRRRASEDLAVSVFHTDIATNDFDSLFTAPILPRQLSARDVRRIRLRGGQVFLRAPVPRIPDTHRLERDRGSLAQPGPGRHI